MGFFDAIKAAYHQVNPFDRGRTWRTHYDNKRRREEEEWRRRNWGNSSAPSNISVGVANPNQNVVVENQRPERKKPVNIFEDLNKNLVFNKPQTTLEVIKNNDTKIPVKPPPGTIIKPTLKVDVARPTQRIILPKPKAETEEERSRRIVNRGLDEGKSWEAIARENRLDFEGVKRFSQATRPNYGIKVEKPKQSVGDRFRDIFDANTEADQWRRQEGNREKGENKDIILKNPGNLISRTPIVGHVVKGLNTAARQVPQVAYTVQQQFATREQGKATQEYEEAVKSGDRNRIAAAKFRMGNAADRLRDIEGLLNASDETFEKNKGGLFNAGTLYDKEAAERGDIKTGITDIALPTAVSMLDLYSLGRGNAVYEAIKRKGLQSGVKTSAPDIGKATVANYGSGDLSARSEGASNADAVKSGLITSILGLAPDIALPALGRGFKDRVIPKVFKGRNVSTKDAVEELDDAAITASAESAIQATRPKPISVARNIPVEAPEVLPSPVRVRNMTEPKPLIQEFPGDASVATPDPLIRRFADEAREEAGIAANNATRPNQRNIDRFEGVERRPGEPVFKITDTQVRSAQDSLIDDYADLLRSMGEGNGVSINPVTGARISNNVRLGDTAGKRMTKLAWRDEAERQLRAGEAEPGIQKQFNEVADPEVQSLAAKGERPDVPVGRPIEVKEAKGIPVRDETVVPVDLPETPGQVRVTEARAPMQAKSEVVAAQAPPPLPREVQEVLDNPKKFNKRQVAAARNQRKLARQMAKTQEDTVAAMERINESSPQRVAVSGQPEGFAPTGEFGRGRRGNAYEKASTEAEQQAGRAEMDVRSVDDLIEEVGQKESFTPGDRRRISAAIENMAKADPDNLETRLLLKRLQTKSRTELGQALAMIPKIIRRSASSDTLTNRWESKIARALDDPAKMTEDDFAIVQRANDNFTLARDRALQLEEQYKRTGSEADFKAWEDAQNAAIKADQDAKFAEVSVAKRVLKGEKGAHVNKVLDDLKKESGVNTMDIVTANMLSGTATGFRNTFGTELAGIENRIFANTRAKITNKLFGENVGGYSRKGARLGRKVGITKFGGDIKRRGQIGGRNPLEWAKNWSTTINSAGESSLQSQVYSRLGKYYQNQLKQQGISGKELDTRMRHAMLTDPDAMGEVYLDSAMKSSGLTGLFEKGQTIERAVVDYVGRHTDSKSLQTASRLLMRLAVGFPTATTNFMYQSAKRLTLGMPSYIETGIKLSKGDKLGAAQAFERAMKESGSGTAVLGLGVALGSQGMITGPYPDDPEERARWEREGISENSINIGGNWFPIPQGAGMLGLPLLTGAAIGRDGGEGLIEMYKPGNLSKLLPTDQMQGFLNMASGDGAPQDFKNFVASSVRAVTPAGALFNQIAKSFDDTKNDTTTKSLWNNILDQVYSGIPGVNNLANIPDKKDDAGNVIKNPDPLPLAFGAISASQGAGEERSAQIAGEVSSQLQSMDSLLNDPNMEGVLEGSALEAFNKAKSGEQLDEKDVKALKEGLVKGVSSEGTDTAYLEREQYDTNLAVLKLKKELMEQDKTVKPSSIKDIDTAIKRGEIYKENQIPYDMIKAYQDVSLTEWRQMGNPDSDEYDPEMYEKLWAMDELMTKAKVSENYKGYMDKPKYFAKEGRGGRGRSGGRGGRGGGRSASPRFIADFGTLKAGSFAPKVQAYETIDQKSGSVPVIRRTRSNIVHKIGSSG